MKKLILLLALFVIPSFAHATEFGVHGEGEKSDSGIFGPTYEKIVQELVSLGKAHSSFSEYVQYGESIRKKPLALIKIGKSMPTQADVERKMVLISGAIHGNEYLNIEDRLPRWLLEEGVSDLEVKKYFDEGGVVYIAPILNPDGYSSRERWNDHWVDLNRDFTVRIANHFGFREPESQALSEYLADEVKANNGKLAVTMDYHCCIGAALRPWSFGKVDPPPTDMQRFDVLGGILHEVFGKDYQYGTAPSVLGYDAVGTTKDYYYETYGAVSITFEGKRRIEDQKFPEHIRMWKKIFAAINTGIF